MHFRLESLEINFFSVKKNPTFGEGGKMLLFFRVDSDNCSELLMSDE